MSQSVNHIAVVDYGMGNLHSVAKALEHVCKNAKVSITADATVVESADRVVFPGVGAIGDCMSEIQRLKINEVINNAIITKPVLGICVGMQLMATNGFEGTSAQGLNWIKGNVIALKPEPKNKYKIPHMGWNKINLRKSAHSFSSYLVDDVFYYFVHSYHFVPDNPDDCIAVTDYGQNVTAIVANENKIGTQFHPEKSQKAGLTLLSSFLNWRI